MECAIEYAGKALKKQQKREKAKEKKELYGNDKTQLAKKAQDAFNKYIRIRDKAKGCISCGNTTRQMHAGHYRPVNRNYNLRFDEDNCHAQCTICNNYLSGNLVKYRENLIIKIGKTAVLALEEDNTTKKYSVQELQGIIEKYKEKTKTLNK